MIIGQITDMHVAAPDDAMSRRFRTAWHLERAVAHVNALESKPDLLLLTGDLVHGGTVGEYERLRKLLSPLGMPLYLIPGNHDHRDNLRAVFSDHDYLPRDGRFLQYTVEHYPVRLIGLDTLLEGKARGELCETRLGWLEARLGEAPDRPTLIFMHHPPIRTGLHYMDRSRLMDAERLGEVVARHSQIERIVCGHVHRPVQMGWHGTVVSICPSTAQQIALDLGEGERIDVIMEPPACQLHLWLPGQGLVSHTSYIGFAATEPLYPE